MSASGNAIPGAGIARRRTGQTFLIGAGLTAALAGLGYVAHIGLRLPFTPYHLAEILRDLTPGPLKTMSIEALAFFAKTLLVFGSVMFYVLIGGAVAAAFSLLIGQRAIAGWLRGILAGLLFFVVTLPISIVRDWFPSDYVIGPLGMLVLYLLWGLALDQTMRGAAARPDIPRGVEAAVMTRRAFLAQTVIGGLFVGVFSGVIGKLMETGLFDGRSMAALPAPTPDANGFLPARGTPPEITANSNFYVVDIGVGGPPKLNRDTWKLSISGMVEKPITYTFESFTSMFAPVPAFAGTLMCISNTVGGDLTGTAIWEGLHLADVLHTAGIKPGVVDVVFRCADGYSESLPLNIALDPDTYLVHRMNGVPLPMEHGYPLRVYIPTKYGEKNPKWITSIELVNTDYKGYWQQQGWTDNATIRHTSTAFTADNFGRVELINPTLAGIGGTANGGGRGVSKVEISVNDGLWQAATLKRPLSQFSWVLWKAQFAAEPGKRYKVRVRVTDGTGAVQVEQETPPHPDGATGYHTREVFTARDPDDVNAINNLIAPPPPTTATR